MHFALQILHGGVKLRSVELAGAQVGVFDAGRFVRSVEDRGRNEGGWRFDGVRLVGFGDGVGREEWGSWEGRSCGGGC